MGEIAPHTHKHSVQVFPMSQLEEKLSWLQAHLFCQRHRANLLSISSPEEEHYVLKLLHEDYGYVSWQRNYDSGHILVISMLLFILL